METVQSDPKAIQFTEEKDVCTKCGIRPVYRCDLCEGCMTAVRDDAKAKIRRLKDIISLKQASKTETPALASEVEALYSQLCEYREKGYLYEAKNDIDQLHRQAVKRLNYLNRPAYKRWWFWLLVVLAVECAVLGYLNATGAMNTEPEGYYNSDGTLKEDIISDLSIIAHKVVRDYLKAPSTAEFDYLVEQYYVFSEAENIFGISGAVTAENSFGVPLENDFFVKFWYGGDTATYTAYEVMIGEETYYPDAD